MTVAKPLSEMYGGIDAAQVQADYQHVLVPGETVTNGRARDDSR